jgi:hypothetical protein
MTKWEYLQGVPGSGLAEGGEEGARPQHLPHDGAIQRCKYTVKKGYRFSRPPPGCNKPSSP